MMKNYYNYNSWNNNDVSNESNNCGVPCKCQVKPCPEKPCHQNPCHQNPCECEDFSYLVGNSVDFTVDKCDSEIKADLTVTYRDTVRIWGQIRDCNGNPVEFAYLKLIKMTCNGYIGVAHTITDCLGFYQFDICPCTDGTCFRLLVSKASTGGVEKTVSTGIQGTNCNPCNPCDLPPCNCK
ncbi:hypothetical protein ACQPU1_13355 [Clostridium paraputrificum]|uniref:hypothetical protein n=1 Tax=Clostridium paraputrificum TaxID=29363 RepID=UPI003D33AE2A